MLKEMMQQIRNELLAMAKLDAETRDRLLFEEKLFDGYAPEMEALHSQNGERLAELMAAYGWLGANLVGEDGAEAAWLIAQHAISRPSLQRRFLAALEEAVARGAAPAWQAAYLGDRIRFHAGQPQRYGLVLDWDENGELSCVLEDAGKVDEWRRAVGLQPFAEHLRRQREAAKREGATPPADYEAYRQKQLAWAQSVGWRD